MAKRFEDSKYSTQVENAAFIAEPFACRGHLFWYVSGSLSKTYACLVGWVLWAIFLLHDSLNTAITDDTKTDT